MSPRLIIIGLFAATALAGCGKVGELDRPHPMFGHPSDVVPETQARHAAAVRARADARAEAGGGAVEDAPQSIEELRSTTNPGGRHKREQPIQAAPGDPDASQPQDAPAPPTTATEGTPPH